MKEKRCSRCNQRIIVESNSRVPYFCSERCNDLWDKELAYQEQMTDAEGADYDLREY